jgi:hypothetical protein
MRTQRRDDAERRSSLMVAPPTFAAQSWQVARLEKCSAAQTNATFVRQIVTEDDLLPTIPQCGAVGIVKVLCHAFV